MKLLYTDIVQDMTRLLAREAQQFAQAGKRVFYLAPNSLSFEKEKKVLETLPQGASVAITVTRFAQLARYFLSNQMVVQPQIDDMGLSMMVFKALSQLAPDALKVYGRLRRDPAFIKQLVQLYKELQTANMTPADFSALSDDLKMMDLQQILTAVDGLLQAGAFDHESKLKRLIEVINSGCLDEALTEVVIVIDGFTRFSAEEESLLLALSERCHEVVIGTYISPKAYRKTMIQGNFYEASLRFFKDLAARYQTKPVYVSLSQEEQTSFSRLSDLLEARYDYSLQNEQLSEADKASLTIWDVMTPQDELNQLARRIRHLLAQGVRYKDILVLLSDVERYQLPLKQVFERFDIPYYLGKAEPMSSHPLVHVVDSLERVKRYRFRLEDVQQLWRSGLYSHVTDDALDRFERYLNHAGVKGLAAFSSPFTQNPKGKYDLEALNQLREQLLSPLLTFLKRKPQKGKKLLEKFNQFLNQISLPEQMSQLAMASSPELLDKHQQVWHLFVTLLEQLETIFGEVVLSVDDFLALLRSGMLSADYRTVPATVDVIKVRSYDLVEPHSAPYVFALGLTQSQFPAVSKESSLLSAEERLLLNAATAASATLQISREDNGKKNRFVFLSLVNAATNHLVLSAPRQFEESHEQLSPYLKELVALGVPVHDYTQRDLSGTADGIGHYRDLLASVIAIQQGALSEALDQDSQTFWSVAVRYLRKRLAEKQVLIPQILDGLATQPVSQEAMCVSFPEEEPIPLSASAVMTFYNNQYLYFLRYVLRLEELEKGQADSRDHGTYLHRIFERLLAAPKGDFQQALEAAIEVTNQESDVSFLYTMDEEARFSRSVLEDIARSSASLLNLSETVETVSQEEVFHLEILDDMVIKGMIDRVDRLSDGRFGVVDYKSSQHQFDLQRFYNGLAPQLVTYLEAVKARYQLSTQQLFGAMYLHLHEPRIALGKVADLADLPQKVQGELTYKGLFQDDEREGVLAGYHRQKEAVYDAGELDLLLGFNRYLFKEAARTIRRGHFAINPYTEDGKSVQGEQLKAITHFEADRHLLTHSRRLLKLPRAGKKEQLLQMIAQRLRPDEREGRL